MTAPRKRARQEITKKDHALALKIQHWGQQLGFQQVGISDIQLYEAETRLEHWLQSDHHGEMSYMARHGRRRSRPEQLLPETRSIISLRMNYLPLSTQWDHVLDQPGLAYISRYALGRDYHKLMRQRIRKLATRIADEVGHHGHRVFVDSAPVLEKALAQKAGLGWIGKHTNLIATDAGSWFFLGEIYTDLDLPATTDASKNHCGDCRRCLDSCPTQAIIAPYQLDARRCISYLTIELKGSIPEPLRPLIGNRIYGCDDCQLVCPWNRFARLSNEGDFAPRHHLDHAGLCRLFAWTETEFLHYTLGSAIRRIGHHAWLRNIAVAMGNTLAGRRPKATAAGICITPSKGDRHQTIVQALKGRLDHPSAMVREHVKWALMDNNK